MEWKLEIGGFGCRHLCDFEMSTAEIKKKFGEPGWDAGNFVRIDLPYPMRVAWDIKTKVTTMWCHKLAAEPFKRVFADLLSQYGLPELQRLGIDLYGGCINVRKMRGGSDWSRHAWGIAIDLDPARNGLRTKRPKAQFSKDEYRHMIGIFYKHGFIGYGPEKNYDWMHFELQNI